jgi:DNA-nicking Smr family endonuclease
VARRWSRREGGRASDDRRGEREDEAGDGDDLQSVDLHGLRPEEALARLARALHRARVQGERRLEVITGRGYGNLRLEPVLRTKVEAWLLGPDGRRFGVLQVARTHRGGCLEVTLERPGESSGGRAVPR